MNGKQPEQGRQISFRPRARLVSILGEHLISDQAVGLVELVKNAYDADANEVRVELAGLAKAETTTVVVRDNGSGMTASDIEGKWFSPAVDHKERDKRENRRTNLGRLPIGEKGVGRFAVQQMGRKLELITRAVSSPEIAIRVDWDHFESGDAYLDTIPVTIEQRSAQVFTGDATGTLISIQQARSVWSRQLLEKVHRTLRRLQSPLRDKEISFRVILKCPEFPEYEDIDPTDILDHAHYEFQALVEGEGQCDFEYHCRHPALAARTKSGSENLIPLAAKELQGEVPSCGPFWINLYVWDRTKDYLTRSGISARELNAQCGVSLFRDGLRVLPYGEPGDDWLLLDQERIQDPSGRIGNNQVIGLVQVLQERNLHLRDKTNREGLIENDAFLDLKAMARGAIRLFITHWKKDRPTDEEREWRKHGSLELARDVATALKDTARDDVQVAIPTAAAGDAPASPDSTGSTTRNDALEEGGVTTVSQKDAFDILIENIAGAAASAQEGETRIERLLTLAATGLAAERVVHEFGRQAAAALEALTKVRAAKLTSGRAARPLEVLETCLGTLRNEFRILAPYEVVERAQRLKALSLSDAIDLALTINKRLIEQASIAITVEGRDFEVRGRPASVVQVLDNLLHNACYWLSTIQSGRERRLYIGLDADGFRLVVADTGPGVHVEARSHLFQPFFSMKAGGTGLGLYISSEIMRRMSGELRLASQHDSGLAPDWAVGAVFVVAFPLAAPGGMPRRTDGRA